MIELDGRWMHQGFIQSRAKLLIEVEDGVIRRLANHGDVLGELKIDEDGELSGFADGWTFSPDDGELARVFPPLPTGRLTPEELREARLTLAKADGLDRPYSMDEFGRLIGLDGKRPDQAIRDYERGTTRISGPLSNLIRAMLETGWRPKPS